MIGQISASFVVVKRGGAHHEVPHTAQGSFHDQPHSLFARTNASAKQPHAIWMLAHLPDPRHPTHPITGNETIAIDGCAHTRTA